LGGLVDHGEDLHTLGANHLDQARHRVGHGARAALAGDALLVLVVIGWHGDLLWLAGWTSLRVGLSPGSQVMTTSTSSATPSNMLVAASTAMSTSLGGAKSPRVIAASTCRCRMSP